MQQKIPQCRVVLMILFSLKKSNLPKITVFSNLLYNYFKYNNYRLHLLLCNARWFSVSVTTTILLIIIFIWIYIHTQTHTPWNRNNSIQNHFYTFHTEWTPNTFDQSKAMLTKFISVCIRKKRLIKWWKVDGKNGWTFFWPMFLMFIICINNYYFFCVTLESCTFVYYYYYYFYYNSVWSVNFSTIIQCVDTVCSCSC